MGGLDEKLKPATKQPAPGTTLLCAATVSCAANCAVRRNSGVRCGSKHSRMHGGMCAPTWHCCLRCAHPT